MNNEELAQAIVDDLFENTFGAKAERLVLELPGGGNGGGWCKSAAKDRILERLSEADVQRMSKYRAEA